MSGHSKWATIKRKKESIDNKRGKLFSKLAKLITIAAKDGADPEANFKLRLAIDKARSANMPADNIERAIAKAAGGGEGADLEELIYEAYGPGGVAVIIKATTDNKNRTLAEIKNILSDRGGQMASEGSVKWMFTERGVIVIGSVPEGKREEIELVVIDSGAQDIQDEEQGLVVYTSPKELKKTKEALDKTKTIYESAEIELITKNPATLKSDKERTKTEALLEELDNHDDVTEIYSNLK